MKKFIRNFKNMSTKEAIQCLFVTMTVCTIVLAGTFVFANHSPKIVANAGQGGFESPTIPVTDDLIDEIAENQNETEAVAFDDKYNLSYFSYRIKQGDMIGKIAEKFDITQDTIISVNNVKNSRTIRPNDYLKIPTMAGILYTTKKDGETVDSIVEYFAGKKIDVDAEKCSSVNHLAKDATLTSGSTIFVPDAVLDWATRQEINGDLFRKPIHARWYKSSSFGWRASPFTGKRSYHSGVDMACPTGTSIFAALPGKVTATGYNSTYGNYVIVTHQGGYKTLYGHMSAITTVKGAYVMQDSRIGKVGSTGMSTGPHLHFTVFKNNKQVNPENLWN